MKAKAESKMRSSLIFGFIASMIVILSTFVLSSTASASSVSQQAQKTRFVGSSPFGQSCVVLVHSSQPIANSYFCELKQTEKKFTRIESVADRAIEGGSIKRAEEHPFNSLVCQTLVTKWDVKTGTFLVSPNRLLMTVASVCSTEAVTTVYNLRVADHHTYFVGGNDWGWDVWVHNALYGTQNPATAWAAETGRAYDRRFRKLWRQFEGQTIGDWEVASVNRRLAKGVQPDLVLVNHETKLVNVHDFTSAYSDDHWKKGQNYLTHLRDRYEGYKVEYTESYWESSVFSVEALSSGGTKYLPGRNRP